MTLFAALTAKDDNATTHSSSSPPEAIQLHSNRVIDFLNGTTVHLLNPSTYANANANGSESKSASSAESDAATKGGDHSTAISNSGQGQSRYFSALSYQAIQTLQDDGPMGASAAASSHVRPDLGVWDCRVNDNGEAPAMLLKRVVMNKKMHNTDSSGEESTAEESDAAAAAGTDNDNNNHNNESPPIVMAVDLSNPTQVQPVLERMRTVILNMHDEETRAKTATATTMPNPHACTTSIKALQTSTFGKTLIQEEVTVKGGSSLGDERIALILAAIVPSSVSSTASVSAAEEYKERQERALILYHLHKFCLEVNCTLVFVSEKGSSNSSNVEAGGEDEKAETKMADNDPLLGRNSTMSIDELGKVIRRVAMGLSPVEQNEEATKPNNEEETQETKANESKEEDDATSQRPPSILAPGSHDAELIHGAYLRNASCEGRWDAGKDDLDVALPYARSGNTTVEEAKDEHKTISGDEEWLSQLASSIGLSPDAATAATTTSSTNSAAEALTPAAVERRKKEKLIMSKKRPVRAASSRHNKDAKPKDEKEVMNFFDNLLKK